TLPAFFSRDSGLPIDARVDSIEDIANVIKAAEKLNAKHGILIAVPAPEEVALASELGEKAIEQATDEADAQGIRGKDVTPFVLARVAELTEGTSMIANR